MPLLKPMTLSERKMLHSLAWMVSQYLENNEGCIDHLCMSAGEQAVDILFNFGIVSGTSRNEEWTAKGKEFLKDLHTQL